MWRGQGPTAPWPRKEGLAATPRPVPSWFHPPLALPPAPKEEGDAWGATKEEGEGAEEGVTPPLMSPLGMVGAGEGVGVQGIDPRHLLHLLTRKAS